MRLQLRGRALAATLLVIGLGASPARADWSGGVDARSSIYQDTDRTSIYTTIVGAHVSPRDTVTISGHYLADIISSASVDVVTAATSKAQCSITVPSTASTCAQQPFHETRHEGAGGIAYADGTHTASLGYVYSVENDWRSHTVSGGYANDFLHHQLTLGLGGSFTTNAVGRSHDPNFHRALNQFSLSFDVGIVGSKRDLISLDYTLMYLKGYQASPYRAVFFNDPVVPGQVVAGPESDPETRIRHAGSVRWNHHLFKDTALKSHLRGYLDSWGVISGTAGTEYVVGFGEIELGGFVRGYAQKGATFYKDTYDARKLFMTADRELSPFIDAFGGLRLGWQHNHKLGFIEELHAELKGSGFAFKFFDFHRLPTRQGVIGELALGGSL
jgi:hypothetical protein